MGTKRFFRHGELPLVILALLTRGPMHRYQLLVALDRMFGDAYEPSTGTVYPATTALEEEGLVTYENDGRRTTYHLSDRGRAVLGARGEQLAQVELRTGVKILDKDSAAAAVDRFAATAKAAIAALGDEAVIAVVDRARSRLVRMAESEGGVQ